MNLSEVVSQLEQINIELQCAERSYSGKCVGGCYSFMQQITPRIKKKMKKILTGGSVLETSSHIISSKPKI